MVLQIKLLQKKIIIRIGKILGFDSNVESVPVWWKQSLNLQDASWKLFIFCRNNRYLGRKGKLILNRCSYWIFRYYYLFLWKGYFKISDKIEFDFPTNDERIDFEESGVKEAIQGSGDSKALMLILSAELKISSALGPIQKNDSSGLTLYNNSWQIPEFFFQGGEGGGGIASFLEEESDPSVFVMSPSALESLSPEDAAAAIEGMGNKSHYKS